MFTEKTLEKNSNPARIRNAQECPRPLMNVITKQLWLIIAHKLRYLHWGESIKEPFIYHSIFLFPNLGLARISTWERKNGPWGLQPTIQRSLHVIRVGWVPWHLSYPFDLSYSEREKTWPRSEKLTWECLKWVRSMWPIFWVWERSKAASTSSRI